MSTEEPPPPPPFLRIRDATLSEGGASRVTQKPSLGGGSRAGSRPDRFRLREFDRNSGAGGHARGRNRGPAGRNTRGDHGRDRRGHYGSHRSPGRHARRTTTAAGSCPSGATVGAALGVTLPDPVGVKGGGGTQLPAGATGMACEYAGKGLNVIIEMISNIDPSSISLFSSKFPVPYASVSGVGDQARSFLAPLGGGKNNEGIVATKGSTLVDITATATPASLAQLEALVNQLL